MRPGSPFEHLPQARLGWHPSPYALKACGEIKLATTAPPSADASRLTIEILDQSRLGSCTSQAIAQAVRASHVRQLLATGLPIEAIRAMPPPLISRLALYWMERARWGQTAFDSGAYLSTGLEELNNFGFCPERFWPYLIEKFADRPSTESFVAASAQRAPNKYVPITSDGDARIEAIKCSLASERFIVFGTVITKRVLDGDWDFSKPIPAPTSSDTIVGGHAMAAEAYTPDGLVPQSWGIDEGINGRMIFSWDYIANDQTTDISIIDAAPLFAPDLLAEAA
jgi:hypothetical protein